MVRNDFTTIRRELNVHDSHITGTVNHEENLYYVIDNYKNYDVDHALVGENDFFDSYVDFFSLI